jgi:hypothetical protein
VSGIRFNFIFLAHQFIKKASPRSLQSIIIKSEEEKKKDSGPARQRLMKNLPQKDDDD